MNQQNNQPTITSSQPPQNTIQSAMPHLSTLELRILESMVDNVSKASVADALGVPVAAVTQLLRKKGVKEYLAELKEAKREMLLNYSIDVIANTLQERIKDIEEDEERSLSKATKLDHVAIAMRLAEILKNTGKEADKSDDPMAKIYQQINIINKQDTE